MVKNAEVKGYPSVFRSQLGYVAAQRAVASQAAFEQATKFIVANMLRSYTKKLEIELLYGQMGYATVSSVTGNVITITEAEWAVGIWMGAENMPIEVRDSSGVSRGECVVTAVDLDARAVTVNALPAGTTGTDVIWHKGAYGKEFAGIHKIITNSGTLFGISASQYNLWKGNTYSTSGTLTLAKVEAAVIKSCNKGLQDDVVCLVAPATWKDLLAEQTALRMFDQSYDKAKLVNGAQALEFAGPNGKITIKMSVYVKQGYAYLLSLKDFVRVGSTDVSFKNPMNQDEYFIHRPDAAAFELRAMCDWAVFTPYPGHNCLVSGIQNSA